MGWVSSFVENPVGRVEKDVSNVGTAAENTVTNIIKDPLPTLVTVGLISVGVDPVTAGAVGGATSAAEHGKNILEGAAIGGAMGYVGGQAAEYVGGAGYNPAISGAAGGAAAGATGSLLTGQDVGQGIVSGAIGGGISGATGYLPNQGTTQLAPVYEATGVAPGTPYQPAIQISPAIPLPQWASKNDRVVVAPDGTVGVQIPGGYTISYDGTTMLGRPENTFMGGGTDPNSITATMQNSIRVGDNQYMDMYGNITDVNGNIIMQAVQPGPITQVADYTPSQEAQYNEYIKQGMSPKQATDLIASQTVTDTSPTRVDIGGSPAFSDYPQTLKGEVPGGYELAPSDNLTNATYNEEINAWIRPKATPTVPVIPPSTETVTTPTTPTEQPTVQAETTTTPTVPVTPITPVTPTVVDSYNYETNDGSVYRNDTMSDGTTSSTLISGPKPSVPTPLAPPTPVTVTPSQPIPEVQATNTNIPSTETPSTQPTEIPELINNQQPVQPIPSVPVIPPTVTQPESETSTPVTYTWGTPYPLRIPTGLNPGFINPIPYYHPTNEAGSQYYWGAHPYQPGPTFNEQLYNTLPYAPVKPYGLGYAQTSASAEDILKAMQNQYPLLNASGPVTP